MQFYEVGGCVRDEILGQPSKDIDYTVVLDEGDIMQRRTKKGDWIVDHPFDTMCEELEKRGFRIFKKDKKFLTARAQFPKYNGHPGLIRSGTPGLTADFVLARKEEGYSDGRRPDTVEPGTLMDDLARRDFTMNAIAKDVEGNLIDPFDGQSDIEDKIIRCVGDPFVRFTEDALRAVRALRFSVTKGFEIEPYRLNDRTRQISPYTHTVKSAMQSAAVLDAIENKISDERIDIELRKMFAHDTVASIMALHQYPALTRAMFSGSVSLTSTMKKVKP